MRLVSFFVPGSVEDAVAVVNELHLCYDFTDMMPGSGPVAVSRNPFDMEWQILPGHHVFVKVTDIRVTGLQNRLKDRGIA